MVLSACGLISPDCEFFGKQCDGCHFGNGFFHWAYKKKKAPLWDALHKIGDHSC